MGYFTYIADQAFKNGENGETLFFHCGPWTKPIVLETEELKERVYSKHLWTQRIFLSLLIFGQPLLLLLIPDVTAKALCFICYLFIVILAQFIMMRIVFRDELRDCKRLDQRVTLRKFYRQMADRHSSGGLSLGLLGSLFFVACGMIMILYSPGDQKIIGMICVGFFGFCSAAWGYALSLKRK